MCVCIYIYIYIYVYIYIYKCNHAHDRITTRQAVPSLRRAQPHMYIVYAVIITCLYMGITIIIIIIIIINIVVVVVVLLLIIIMIMMISMIVITTITSLLNRIGMLILYVHFVDYRGLIKIYIIPIIYIVILFMFKQNCYYDAYPRAGPPESGAVAALEVREHARRSRYAHFALLNLSRSLYNICIYSYTYMRI